jgi:hypothetical protein
MSDELTLVEENDQPADELEPRYPDGLHLRIRFDADSCIVAIYEGNRFLATGNYSWVKNYESWQECRDNAVSDAMEKVAIIQKYGPPPASEVVEL